MSDERNQALNREVQKFVDEVTSSEGTSSSMPQPIIIIQGDLRIGGTEAKDHAFVRNHTINNQTGDQQLEIENTEIPFVSAIVRLFQNSFTATVNQRNHTEEEKSQIEEIPDNLQDIVKMNDEEFKTTLFLMFDLEVFSNYTEVAKSFAENINKTYITEARRQSFMDKTTEKLNFNIVESGYDKYYPDWNKIHAAGELLMSLFNLANMFDRSTNQIQNMIDKIQMEVQLNMKLESDVDILEKFLSVFKPKIRYISIYLPNKISENKLKKLLNSLAELNTKIPHVVIHNIRTISDPAIFNYILNNISDKLQLFFEADKTNMELVLQSIHNSNFECDVISWHESTYYLTRCKNKELVTSTPYGTKKINLKKLNKQNIDDLYEITKSYKLDIRINSVEEVTNLHKLSVKYNVKIDIIAFYINETIASYIPMILSILSTDNVSIRILEIYNVENIRQVIELSDEVLDNISYQFDLRSNVETPIDEQQQIVKLTEKLMKNHNKEKEIQLSFKGKQYVIKGSKPAS